MQLKMAYISTTKLIMLISRQTSAAYTLLETMGQFHKNECHLDHMSRTELISFWETAMPQAMKVWDNNLYAIKSRMEFYWPSGTVIRASSIHNISWWGTKSNGDRDERLIEKSIECCKLSYEPDRSCKQQKKTKSCGCQ